MHPASPIFALAASLFLPLAGAIPALAQADAATPVPAAVPVEFVWETAGGDQPLSYPMDVTLDPDGNLWVVDVGTSRFQIFSPDGEFLEAWGREGDGPGEFRFLGRPVAEADDFGGDVAFDGEGNFYVADLGNARVQKFAPDRTFLAEWASEGMGEGQFLRPWSLDVDAEGRVYVADVNRGDVQVFSADGQHLGTPVTNRDPADGVVGVTFVTVAEDGVIWVTDYDGKLLAYSPEGELMGAYGRYGIGAGQFSAPYLGSVADGRVYVADSGNDRIQVFDAAGRLVAAWGREGDGPGEFQRPTGVTLDGQGHAYVADFGNHRIQKFRLLPPLAGATPLP